MTRFESPEEKQARFEKLLEKGGDRAFHFAFRLAGNEQDARDLVQEAFLRAYERLDDYDPNKPFDAWIGTILRNIFIDGVRRLSHRQTVSMDAEPREGAEPLSDRLSEGGRAALDRLAAEEADRMVQAALQKVDPEMRTALVLCDMEAMSYEDVAKVMGCPIGTVRSRLFRGRARLRRMLERYVATGEGRREGA